MFLPHWARILLLKPPDFSSKFVIVGQADRKVEVEMKLYGRQRLTAGFSPERSYDLNMCDCIWNLRCCIVGL